jgi:hypothetical protein
MSSSTTAGRIEYRSCKLQILAERGSGMLAVDVHKSGSPFPELASSSAGCMAPLSAFKDAAFGLYTMLGAVGFEASMTSGLGQSNLSMPSACSPGFNAWASAMKKRLERADLHHRPVNPHLALHAHQCNR